MSWERTPLLDVWKLRTVFSSNSSSRYKILTVKDGEDIDIEEERKSIREVSCFWDFADNYVDILNNYDEVPNVLLFFFNLKEDKVDLRPDEIKTYISSLVSIGLLPDNFNAENIIEKNVAIFRDIDKMKPAQFYLYLCNIRSIVGHPDLVRMVAHLVSNHNINPLTAIGLSFTRRLSDRDHHWFSLRESTNDGKINDNNLVRFLIKVATLSKGEFRGQKQLRNYVGDSMPKYGFNSVCCGIPITLPKASIDIEKFNPFDYC